MLKDNLRISDVVQGTPPVVVGGMTIFGIPLSEWLVALTIFYTIIITLIALRKLIAPLVKHRQNGTDDPPCADSCPVAKRLNGGK